jgi:hypothetical protein
MPFIISAAHPGREHPGNDGGIKEYRGASGHQRSERHVARFKGIMTLYLN